MRSRLEEYFESVLGFKLLFPDWLTMFVFSCLIGTYVCVKACEKEGIKTSTALNTLLVTFLFGLIGARFLHVIMHYRFYLNYPFEIVALWKGGFVSYGGLFGAASAAIVYLRINRISIRKFADCCTQSIALGIFLTRIGCFMNGCCFGKVCNLPWALRFPEQSPPYIFQLYNGQLPVTAKLSLPVHPTQLYYSLSGLLLLFAVMLLKKYIKTDGYLFLGFFVLYSIARFIVEFYRAEHIRSVFNYLSPQQIFSVATVLAILLLFLFSRTSLRVNI